MRVSLYARVSTVDRGQNPEIQLEEMRSFVASRGWEINGEYIDRISGAKERRPALDRLLKDAWKGKIHAIIVLRLDRLGRSLKHLVNLLTDLMERNVALISIKEGIDFSTSSGRLMFHIVASLAEFERDLIRERVRAGLAYARSKGVRIGRRAVCMDTERIQSLRKKGWTIRRIAKTLSCAPTSVWKSLQSFNAK